MTPDEHGYTYTLCGAISAGFVGDEKIGLMGNRICDRHIGHEGHHAEVLRQQQRSIIWEDGMPAEWEERAQMEALKQDAERWRALNKEQA